MQTQPLFRSALTGQHISFAVFHRRQLQPGRWFRAAMILVLTLSLFSAARAKADSCSLSKGVPVGMQGLMCAFTTFHISLAGVTTGTGGLQCGGLFDRTPKVWPKLIPDKTYTLTAGNAICVTTINFDVPPGYSLFVDGVETNTVEKSDGGLIFSGDGSWNVVLRKKCDCGNNRPSQAGPRSGSVIWEAGLGNLVDGRSAEHISIREEVLSSAIYTPSVLVYSPPANSTEVDVVRNADGSLRQVKAPQAFADVVAVSSSEFDVRYYKPADVGSKNGGIYSLNGQPYVTWKIKNPDPTTTTKLQILKRINGNTVDQSEYVWDPTIDSWTLSTGWLGGNNYSRIETKTVSYPTSSSRMETFTVKDGQQVVSKIAKTYFSFPWGEELVEEVVDPDAAALTTTYAYYQDPHPTQEHRYRKLQSVTFPDGSWEKYDYDVYWNLRTVMRPWKDLSMASATEANSHLTIYGYSNSDNGEFATSTYVRYPFDTEEKIGGVTVRKSRINRSIASTDPEYMISEADASYASSNNGVPSNLIRQTITTKYHFLASPFLANRVASVVFPDGRKDSYTYEKGNYVPNANPALSQFTPDVNGTAQRETVIHGTSTSPNGVAFKTTKDTLVRDQYGNQVLLESYVYNGTDYERISWTVSDFDDRGNVVMGRNHKGEVITAVYDGVLKTSEVDATGIETTYTYDVLNRLKTETKKGILAGGGFPAQTDITTTYTYDVEGHRIADVISGGGPTLTTTRAYDKAGRLTRETDWAGLSATHTYANGGRTHTVTHPGGATEILDKYLNGLSKSVTGSAVVAQYFDYGVNGDGTRYTQEFIGSAGLSSPRWAKVTKDWVGRTVAVEQPSFTGTNVIQSSTYNSLDQLQKQTTTAGATKVIADKLFEYDELGNVHRTGSDIDADGTLALVSTDRMTETDNIYEKVGSDWFRVITKRTYLVDNNNTPTIQVQRERLNNFALNGSDQTISEITGTDVAGNIVKLMTAVDRAAKKQTATTDTPDSNNNAVSIIVNGLVQSSVPTTPQSATTYLYDSLGRQTSMTDPQKGTTTRTYSASTGQLSSSNDGAGDTQYEYYPAGHVGAGKLKAQTNPAGKKIYFNYSNRGELLQTWGDATYPLEYVYDAYGQRTELHTFRGGQNWTASIWPSSTTGTADVTKWIYQESTGLFTQKQDAVLKGPVYTYDELGRMKTRVWARSITCTYGYDANTGELRNVTYSDSTPAIAFTYDRGGRQASVSDAAGAHVRTFNAAGDLQTEQITGGILDGVNITVGYDSFLRRSSLQSVQGANTLSSQTYGYDPTARLETITSGNQTVTYGYHANSGLLTSTSFTGGTNIARGYDSLGRLLNITTTPAADTPQSYTYSYNSLNQRWSVSREDGSYWTFLYNDRDELVSGKKYWSDTSAVWGAQTEYNFDNVGNRKSAKSGGNQVGNLRQSSYVTNALNQYSQRTVPGAVDITGTANSAATVTVNNQSTSRKGDYFYNELAANNSSSAAYTQVNVVGARNNFGAGGEDAVTEKGGRVFVPQATETFNHDFDGNLTSDGRWVYTWDAENQLVAMEAAAGVPVEAKSKLEFAYDYTGRRIQKRMYVWNTSTSTYELQSVTKFVYDGWNVVAELDAASTLVRSYVWAKDLGGGLQSAGGVGGLLLIREGVETYQAGYDGNGNVVALVKAGVGTISAAYEYDPFSNSLKSTGNYAARNPFKFSTKYTDQESDLIYYGYRYANSQTGRWLSKDPMQEDGGVNLYRHLDNNPIVYVDPLGLQIRERNFDSRDRNPATGERYGVYRDYDIWEAQRTKELRERMIRKLPAPTGKEGIEFFPDSSSGDFVKTWSNALKEMLNEMLHDCECLKAFKDAGLDLEAANKVGFKIGAGSLLKDDNFSDDQLGIPTSDRQKMRKRVTEVNAQTYSPNSGSDLRSRIFFSPDATNDGLLGWGAGAKCTLRAVFAHELIHVAGAGGLEPAWWHIRGNDLNTWMPRELDKILAACGCK